jgi:S-(hydroxymethyl)glutathione dehydrogenase / alcohol dehydrogenase
MTGLGTFAEMMTVSQHSVVKVESDLPDEQLALIGCGVTTGVGAALNTARVEPGSIVAVIGCGGVGQAVIQGARIAGAARIIAIDPVPMKRDAALSFGATDVIDPGDADPVQAVKALSGGRGADYAFEVIGTAGTIRQAVDTTRPGGTAVMVGVPKLGTDVPIPAMSVLQEKKILGCVYGSARVRRDFPRPMSLIEQGKLDVGAMVTRTMHLDEVNDAIAAMQAGEVIRSVLV